jgi:hypothetical protein
MTDGPAVRITRPTFASPQEAAHLEAVRIANPRRKGESWLAYIARLAELGGLVPGAPEREPGQEG